MVCTTSRDRSRVPCRLEGNGSKSKGHLFLDLIKATYVALVFAGAKHGVLASNASYRPSLFAACDCEKRMYTSPLPRLLVSITAKAAFDRHNTRTVATSGCSWIAQQAAVPRRTQPASREDNLSRPSARRRSQFQEMYFQCHDYCADDLQRT